MRAPVAHSVSAGVFGRSGHLRRHSTADSSSTVPTNGSPIMNRTSLAWALLWLGFLPGIAAAAPSATITALAGPTSANAGESYGAISYTVTNQGDAATPNTPLHFFLSTSPSPSVDSLKTAYANSSNPQPGADAYFLVSRLLSPIEASQSSSGSLTVSWIPNWLSGTYYLTAMTDFWYLAQELTNVATMATPVTVAGPFIADLLVTALSAPASMNAGQQYTISGTTANDSSATGTARNYDVALYLSVDDLLSPDDTYLEVLAPGPLAPGQSVTSSNLMTISNSMAGGTYRLIAKADRLGAVYESNEQNNIFVMPDSVVINGPFITDLAVTALNGPTTASAGDPYTFSYTVANLSSLASANNVHVGVYLSTDATLSTDDFKLADAGIGNLAPSGVYTQNNFQLVLPTSMGGTYWLIAMVDPGSNLLGSITEANENNNVLVMADPVTIDGPHLPDLQVATVSGPSAASVGQPYTIQWSVTNSGEWPLNGTFFINFYLTQNTATLSSQSPVAWASGSMLSAGATRTGTTTVAQVPALLNGTYQLAAKVRCATGITESDTTNNILVGNSVLLGVDALPPAVSIESPANNLLTSAASVELVVLATDDAAVQAVTANGAPLALGGDGLWRALAALSEGNNTFDVVATDTGGYQTHQSVTVRRDSTPPTLVVTSPVGLIETTSTSVSVTGQVTDASSLNLTIGGAAVTIGAGGSFTYDLALQPGDNLVEVTAVDAAGNRTTQTVHVHRVTGTSLQLVVSYPPQGFRTASSLVLVRGSATGGLAPLVLTINGDAVPVAADGTFAAGADLAIGPASVSVTLTDHSGATTQQVIAGQRLEAGGGGGGGGGSGNINPVTMFTYDAIGNLTKVVNTATDINNCGTIGTVCQGTQHGTPACRDGVCVITSGGQVIDVNNDPNNCGDAGHVCPAAVDHGIPTCSYGVCGFECETGYIPVDGRCVDLKSDTTNCGYAGIVCQGTDTALPVCIDGVCRTSAAPVVHSVNGATPPGQQFRVPFWDGVQVVGENLQNVTYIEVEYWGMDTVDGSSGGAMSIPLFTGEVEDGGYHEGWSSIGFMATPTSLTIPQVGFQRWMKLRLHYMNDGVDDYVLADVAVSFAYPASVTAPPPQITSVNVVRYLRTGQYNPDTGFIPTVNDDNPILANNDLTIMTPAPVAVMAFDSVWTEYPILKITRDGVYIRAGIKTFEFEGVTDWVCSNGDATFTGTGFVFPYTNAPSHRVHLNPNMMPRYDYPARCLSDVVVLRGNNLLGDGPIYPSLPIGNPLPEGAVVASDDIAPPPYSRSDRLLAGGDPKELVAYLELDSARGTAATPWPLNWLGTPEVASIDGAPIQPNTSITVQDGDTVELVGHWFVELNAVMVGGMEQRYSVIDDKHLLITIKVMNGSCDATNGGGAGLYIANSIGGWEGSLHVNTSLPPCETPPPEDIPDEDIDVDSTIFIFDLPVGDCTNSFCG